MREVGGSLLQGLSPHLLDVNGMHAFSFKTERDSNNTNLLPSEKPLSSGTRGMSHGACWMHNRAQASSPSEDVSTRTERTCFILPGGWSRTWPEVSHNRSRKSCKTTSISPGKTHCYHLELLHAACAILRRFERPHFKFLKSSIYVPCVVRRYLSYCCKRACWHTKA